MDLDLDEVIALLEDPKTKDEIMQRIMDNAEELKDENGEVFKLIHLNDSNLPISVFAFMEKMSGFRLHDCRKFPVREDDIFVLDYAKSGTHWLCNLIHLMLQKDGQLDSSTFKPVLLEFFSEDIVEKRPSPRIMSSHLSPKSLPQEIFSKGSKAIFLYRNPKDTAVSLYYHLKKTNGWGYKISWNCHVENFMKGKVPMFDFFKYLNAWEETLKEKKELDILVLCYEDMKKTPLKELQKVNDYLGLNLSGERLQEILGKCSLENLKHVAETSEEKSPLIDKDGKSILYRKGIIGDWKNHFTVAQNEEADEVIKAKFSSDSMYIFQYS